MNKQKELTQQINQLKLEKKFAKLQGFNEFLTKHFGRQVQMGDVIERVGMFDKVEQYSISQIDCIEGSHQLVCYPVKNGKVITSLRESIENGCNLSNCFGKTYIKDWKFKLAA
jgi:hypothetical protein